MINFSFKKTGAGTGNDAARAAQMVREQIVRRGVRDQRVINAMVEIPRHLFIPGKNRGDSYGDHPVQIGEGQTISQPYMVAVMTELLELKGSEKVLEIGTGSGYQTAILAKLAGEVFTVERIADLQDKAKKVLETLGLENIRFKSGDGTLGWNEFKPYDRILVTAASRDIPETFSNQLAADGIMVLPVGDRSGQMLTLARKKDDGKLDIKELFPCVFVPLIGKFGWIDNQI